MRDGGYWGEAFFTGPDEDVVGCLYDGIFSSISYTFNDRALLLQARFTSGVLTAKIMLARSLSWMRRTSSLTRLPVLGISRRTCL